MVRAAARNQESSSTPQISEDAQQRSTSTTAHNAAPLTSSIGNTMSTPEGAISTNIQTSERSGTSINLSSSPISTGSGQVPTVDRDEHELYSEDGGSPMVDDDEDDEDDEVVDPTPSESVSVDSAPDIRLTAEQYDQMQRLIERKVREAVQGDEYNQPQRNS